MTKRIIMAVIGFVLVSVAGVIVKGMLTSNLSESTDVDETTSESTSEYTSEA